VKIYTSRMAKLWKQETIFETKTDNVKIIDQTETNINIKYINIQGLSKQKMGEVEMMMEEDVGNKVFLLVETHQKIDKIETNENLSKIVNMREMSDKKGGGMMALYKKQDVEIVEDRSNSRDILKLDITIRKIKFKIILVYFAVRTSKGSEERNKNIRK